MRFTTLLTVVFAALVAAAPATVDIDHQKSQEESHDTVIVITPDGPKPVSVDSPLATKYKHFEKRNNQEGWHIVYQHEKYQGRSERLHYRSGRCYNLLNGWGNTITSVKVADSWRCSYHDQNDCRGESTDISGWNSNVGRHWNDRFSSYWCYYGQREPKGGCGIDKYVCKDY